MSQWVHYWWANDDIYWVIDDIYLLNDNFSVVWVVVIKQDWYYTDKDLIAATNLEVSIVKLLVER